MPSRRPAPAQGLAVHRQPGDGRGLLLPQPLADDGHQLADLAGGEHTAEGGVAGRAAHAVLVRQHAQGCELALGPVVAEAAVALTRGPADPWVAGLDVEGGAGEQEEGDVAEGGAGDVGLVEVVVLLEGAIEVLALVGRDGADDDAGEGAGFRG